MADSTGRASLALPPIHTDSLCPASASASTSLQPASARGSLSNLSSRSSSPRPSSPSTLATSPHRENGHSDSERDREPSYTASRLFNRSSPSLASPATTNTLTPNQGGQESLPTSKSLRQRSSFFGLVRPKPSKNRLDASWETPSQEHRPRATHDQQPLSPSQPVGTLTPENHTGQEFGAMASVPSNSHPSSPHYRVPVRMSSRDFREPSQQPNHASHANESEVAGTSGDTDGAQLSRDSHASPTDASTHRHPSGSSQVSVREIRRAATSKLQTSLEALPLRLSTLVPPSQPSSASTSPSGSRRPSKATLVNLSPRSPVMSRLRGDSDDERRGQAIHDEDEGSAAGSRGISRRLTMVDFLAAERSPRSHTSPLPSTSALTAAQLTTSRSATLTSLRSSPTQPRQRPRSLLVEPSSSGQEEVETLSASTPEALPTSSIAAQRKGEEGTARTIPLQLNTNFTGPSAQPFQSCALEEQVVLTIKPMTDIMTMFGSTQTSANYSLSGSVEVSLPRSRAKRQVPADVREESSRETLTMRQEAGAATPSSTEPPRQADSSANLEPDLEASMTVKELTVLFNGYSTYADHSGRYSGIRLCNIKQDLLPAEASLPLQADLQDRVRNGGDSHDEALKYEVQFDLSVPGWLPGSAFSRFGSTFFCLSAIAIVVDSSGRGAVLQATTRNPSSPSLRAPFSAPVPNEGLSSFQQLSTLSPSVPNSSTDARGARTAPNSATSPTYNFDELSRTISETGKAQLQPAQKHKSKPNWLTQKAKAISLKARPSPVNGFPSGSGSTVGGMHRGGSANTASARLNILRNDDAGTKRLADGTLEVKSKKQLIIVRRCRDVVPVPVARMAILSDNASLATQDPPSQSASRGDSPDPGLVATAAGMTQTQSALSSTGTTSMCQSGNAPLERQEALPIPSPSVSPVDAEVPEDATATTPAAGGATPTSVPSAPVPAAPIAPQATFDPAKVAPLARQPPAPLRTSSAMDSQEQALPRTTTLSSTDGGIPMRHFLHRPILHPPVDSGIQEGSGLPFSLTISVPSHVQVQAAEILSFGVQVEVGRSAAWSKVRELGGLRLRDMELVCLQTERHTSVPSRTFCSTFPVPPEPKIAAFDLPILPGFSPPLNNRRVTSSQEARVRLGYDPEPIATYLAMAESGRQVPLENNDVERVRAGVVGPPPGFKQDKHGETRSSEGQLSANKGKDRAGGGQQQRRRPAGPPGDAPGGRLVGTSRHASASASATADPSLNGRPLNSTSATSGFSLGNNTRRAASTSHASGARPTAPVLYGVPPASASPADRQIAPEESNAGSSPAEAPGSVISRSEEAGSTNDRPQSTSPSSRRGGRGRRAYEATIRGLSAFATAVLDAGFEEAGPSTPYSPFGGNHDSFITGEQPKASYHFKGDDGHGVDLTKGRVRMTVNLPMVTSSATLARREATPQLLPDYESPHMRVRHKLKVKLGFGFGPKPLAGDGEWGQSLVMCVPVRFTEAPPQEVSDQFAPMPITMTSVGEANAGMIQPIITVADPNSAPVLPAYTQLFRDDGSRLNEAEDLPAYPGPRRGASATNGGSGIGGVAIRPVLSSRGSVTGPPRPIRISNNPGEGGTTVGGGARRPSISSRGSVTGRFVPRAGSSSTAGATAARGTGMPASDGEEDLVLPLDNSLAPEQVVDDALRSITDPDESRAEIREQEREMAELENERDLLISAALRSVSGIEEHSVITTAAGGGTGRAMLMTTESTDGSTDSPGEDGVVGFASQQEDEDEDEDDVGDETGEYTDAHDVDEIIGEELGSGILESPSAYELRTRTGRGRAEL